MKKKLFTFLVNTLLLVIFLSVKAIAKEFPAPQGFVNDYAGLYSAEFREELESKLSDFEKESTAEIAVVTINSLEGDTVENVAVELFKQWGIGKKGEDNGLLLLIAKEDRKMRIEVGYGLEPKITDAAAGRIIRDKMTPEFKKEDYEKGTLAAVEEIMGLISGEISSSERKGSLFPMFSSVNINKYFILGSLFAGILFIYISAFLARSKSFYAGGVVGVLLGAILGILLASVLGVIFGALLFGLAGLYLDWILSGKYRLCRKSKHPTSWWKSWGGFSSGGGGGGGFGGFGGGSSGGGGASGGW